MTDQIVIYCSTPWYARFVCYLGFALVGIGFITGRFGFPDVPLLGWIPWAFFLLVCELSFAHYQFSQNGIQIKKFKWTFFIPWEDVIQINISILDIRVYVGGKSLSRFERVLVNYPIRIPRFYGSHSRMVTFFDKELQGAIRARIY
ncbi:MAG: hypothetical protein ABI970_24430 [Chloroflexota bacterium]